MHNVQASAGSASSTSPAAASISTTISVISAAFTKIKHDGFRINGAGHGHFN
jgi:hypothetical protein